MFVSLFVLCCVSSGLCYELIMHKYSCFKICLLFYCVISGDDSDKPKHVGVNIM